MSNQKSKRQIKRPSKLNDHVVENLSQRRNGVDTGKVLVNDNVEVNGKIRLNNSTSIELEGEKDMEIGVDKDACEVSSEGVCDNKETNTETVNGITSDTFSSPIDAVNKETGCKSTSASMLNSIDTSMPESNLSANVESIDNANNGNKDTKSRKTYAHMVKTEFEGLNNKFCHVPTRIVDDGSEFVVFDEEIVLEGSKRWELTTCGYFVG